MDAIDWEVPSDDALLEDKLTKFVNVAAADYGVDGSSEARVVNWFHPLMLTAKTASTSGGSPNWKQAINGPFADEHCDAARVGVETVENKAWEVVEHEVNMNVLSSA